MKRRYYWLAVALGIFLLMWTLDTQSMRDDGIDLRFRGDLVGITELAPPSHDPEGLPPRESATVGAWLKLTPLTENGATPSGLRLVHWGSGGIRPISFAALRLADRLHVPVPPEGLTEPVCLLAEGFAPYDVTDLLAHGGEHQCVLRQAGRLEITICDLDGAVPPDGILQLVDEASTSRSCWLSPIAVNAGTRVFWLPSGSYRPTVTDDSIAVWSGGARIRVEASQLHQRAMVLVGVVATALRWPDAKPDSLRIVSFPDGLVPLHAEQVSAAAERLQQKFDKGVMLNFAATRSITYRTVSHELQLQLDVAGGPAVLRSSSFQPLDRLVVQELSLQTPTTVGQFRIRVAGPDGVDIPGLDVRVLTSRGSLVLIAKSGDDWRPLAAGVYRTAPDLPPVLVKSGTPLELKLETGKTTELVIPLEENLVARELRIERPDGMLADGATVRLSRGERVVALRRTLKAGPIRVWVPPARLRVEVVVTETAQTSVELDFAAPTKKHTIVVP